MVKWISLLTSDQSFQVRVLVGAQNANRNTIVLRFGTHQDSETLRAIFARSKVATRCTETVSFESEDLIEPLFLEKTGLTPVFHNYLGPKRCFGSKATALLNGSSSSLAAFSTGSIVVGVPSFSWIETFSALSVLMSF
jgi:hypothetical protein